MTRNGTKTAIREGGLGRLLLDGDPLVSSILVSLYEIDLSKYLIYPNNFRMKFSVSDHCDILQGAEGKKLVHQVVSHCSSNKASLNRQLVLSGLFSLYGQCQGYLLYRKAVEMLEI